jgi:hypothetical protein
VELSYYVRSGNVTGITGSAHLDFYLRLGLLIDESQ